MTTPERFARLPQWAQQEITRLERNVDYWEEKATAGERESDTRVQHAHKAVQNLPPGSRIEFDIEDGTVEVRTTEDGRIYVRVDGGSLAFTPSASNSGHIQSIRR